MKKGARAFEQFTETDAVGGTCDGVADETRHHVPLVKTTHLFEIHVESCFQKFHLRIACTVSDNRVKGGS